MLYTMVFHRRLVQIEVMYLGTDVLEDGLDKQEGIKQDIVKDSLRPQTCMWTRMGEERKLPHAFSWAAWKTVSFSLLTSEAQSCPQEFFYRDRQCGITLSVSPFIPTRTKYARKPFSLHLCFACDLTWCSVIGSKNKQDPCLHAT